MHTWITSSILGVTLWYQPSPSAKSLSHLPLSHLGDRIAVAHATFNQTGHVCHSCRAACCHVCSGPSFRFFSTTGTDRLRKFLSYFQLAFPMKLILESTCEWCGSFGCSTSNGTKSINPPTKTIKHPQIIPSTSMSCPSKKKRNPPISITFQIPCSLSPSLTQPADMMALQTITGKQQFWEEPTARNSKRLPQKGKGAVRLRSYRGGWMRLQPVKDRMNFWVSRIFKDSFKDIEGGVDEVLLFTNFSWHLRYQLWLLGSDLWYDSERTPNQWG